MAHDFTDFDEAQKYVYMQNLREQRAYSIAFAIAAGFSFFKEMTTGEEEMAAPVEVRDLKSR